MITLAHTRVFTLLPPWLDQPLIQQSLKDTVKGEIGTQVLSFPSMELSCILSPKTHKSGVKTHGELLHICHFDCQVDKEKFEFALQNLIGKKNLEQLKPFKQVPRSSKASCYKDLATFVRVVRPAYCWGPRGLS